MRDNIKIKREIQPEDVEAIALWKEYLEGAGLDEDELKEQLAHLERIEELLKASLDGANPLHFNTEFVINDSGGNPMTIYQANSDVVWNGALVAPTIKLRAIDFKNIDGMQTLMPSDLVSIQVEVNGKKSAHQPIGSSVGCFGGAKKSTETPSGSNMSPDESQPAGMDVDPKKDDTPPGSKRSSNGESQSAKKIKTELQESV